MNTTTKTETAPTATCLTCGSVKDNPGSPWAETRVAHCTACTATFNHALATEDRVKHARITAAMGVYPWDRARGEEQRAKATADLNAALRAMTMERLRAYGEYRKMARR